MGQIINPCGSATCVQVELVDGEVKVTSTVRDNDGEVYFTRPEWDTFIADVKAGKWDDTVRSELVR